MSCSKPNWRLLLECAERLTAAGTTPFSRQDLIGCVKREHPDRLDQSLNPTIQGMTENAPGGMPAACGTPFVRVGRGLYRLSSRPDDVPPVTPGVVVSPPASMHRAVKRRTPKRPIVEDRIAEVILGFDEYVAIYDEQVPFTRSGQYAWHRRTVDLRREAGSVAGALADERFLPALHATLGAWGIGRRGSRLAPLPDFGRVLMEHAPAIVELEGHSIEDPEGADLADRVWALAVSIPIVDNRSRIVPGSKLLHHLLPDLVPPMDRAWTGAFFSWTAADPQQRQEQVFSSAFRDFCRIAREVRPSRLVGEGWRTSATKVLDNAVIGYCKSNGIPSQAAKPQL